MLFMKAEKLILLFLISKYLQYNQLKVRDVHLC